MYTVPATPNMLKQTNGPPGPANNNFGPVNNNNFGPPGPGMGPQRHPMKPVGPPGQNLGPPGQNMGPPGQNMGPPGQNLGPPGQNMGPPSGQPRPMGGAPRPMGHPPSGPPRPAGMAFPPSNGPSMGPQTQSGPMRPTGPPAMGPPSSMGQPNSFGPPSSMAPPTSMGQPHSMGPPSAMGPPSSMAPPTSMGMGPPTSMGPPSSMAPPTSMGQPPGPSIPPMGPPRPGGPPGPAGMAGPRPTGPPGPGIPPGPNMGPTRPMGQPGPSFGGPGMSGPPGGMSGPPGGMSGPPGGMSGPPGGMSGPPGGQPRPNMGPPRPMGAAGPPRPMGAPGMGQGPPGMGQGPPGPGMGYPPNRPPSGPGGPSQGPPGMSYPNSAGQPGYPNQPPGMNYPNRAQARRSLDPDQMPSPINVMDEDEQNNGGFFDTRDKGQTPPLVTTKFTVRDCGNASPRFIRSTMYTVPSTPDMLKQTSVPFALVVSPFAAVHEDEHEPPLSDFGPIGPVRCVRCKAYMCPFMQFIDGGRRFQCVFCKATTEVPQEYFQHLDHTGLRLDHYQRPELCLGAYELVATKDYCRDSVEPKVPGVIFAIDVSYPMIKEGIVQLVCKNMKRMLKSLPKDMNIENGEHMRVGFMTYDSKVHFYNINKGLSQPQMLTVGDVGDMFVPLVEGLMVNAEEAETVIDSLMEQIPVMFAENEETETVLGPVIQAGKEAFKAAQCAGKLIVFHHNLPVAEAPGKLKNRDDRKLLGTEKEKTVLVPQNKFYNELGQECVAVGCSVDLFLFNNAYVDVATLSQVSRLTGGQVYKYTCFQEEIDGERFLNDLERNLSRPVAFDAIMRIRTSTGVRPVDFYGSFYMANTTDAELASINGDSAIACEIKHDDKLTEEDGVYIQVAILFTSCSGKRRLRILNLSLNTGSTMADMYRNCELDATVNFIAKQSMSRLMESNPKTVKENLISQCANILACYRKNCATPSSAGQLILPECMKLLPLYTNCLIKCDAISGGSDVGCDDRAYMMSLVSSMDVSWSVAFFYPRLYPIHDLNPSENGLPNQIRCSSEKIRDDGVYLMDNGIYLFMYIGLAMETGWVQDVFGVSSAAHVNIGKPYLESRDTPMSKRVNEIIDLIRRDRPRFMRIVYVGRGGKLDILFRHNLVEDKKGNDGGFSYVDFLCHMHKEVRAILG